MKKTIIFGLVVITILIVSGCSQQQIVKEYVCPDGSIVTKPSLCPKDTDKDGGLHVACSSPADCPHGYCDMSSKDPSKWSCKGGTPPDSYCGDGDCDKLTENSANCPADCS